MSYDANKNVVSQDASNYFRDWNASFDANNRLTSWDEVGNRSRNWDLSLVGNWSSYTNNGTTETRVHDDKHQLKSTSTGQRYSYDARGNQTKSAISIRRVAWDIDGHLSYIELREDKEWR